MARYVLDIRAELGITQILISTSCGSCSRWPTASRCSTSGARSPRDPEEVRLCALAHIPLMSLARSKPERCAGAGHEATRS